VHPAVAVYPQLHAVLLQGIALAGFNVVDMHALSARLARPDIAIVRHRPRKIRRAQC
jgi:endonuclease V-like protein UPF0215 family